MKYDIKAIYYAAALALGLCACGPRQEDGAVLEKQGRFLQAARAYAGFAASRPQDPAAPEALLKASRLYVDLGLCGESLPLLEKIAREYPGFNLPPEDFRRIYICPDYFPVTKSRIWNFGDSQTFGRNARQEFRLNAGPAAAEVRVALYAGRTLVSRQKRGYYLKGRELHERQGNFDTVILSYPLEKGKTWTSRAQEGRLEFLVESTGQRVKVKAGEFQACVKVRRRMAGQPSWVVEYYAPWTGKLLTAVAGPGYENRVMELTSYE